MSESASQCNGNTGGHDSVGADNSQIHIGDVHRSAPSAANSTGLTHDFHKKHVQIDTTRDDMTVPTMISSHCVALIERRHDTGHNRPLSYPPVDESWPFAVGEQPGKPDFPHPT